MIRKASAIWTGSLQKGQGEVTTESGALKTAKYSFGTRFGKEAGTNPEELIGAAHAGCFAMALSAALSEKKFEAKKLEVHAEVSIEKEGIGWSITHSHLNLIAEIPGIDQETFEEIAAHAKDNCPVSKALTAEISLESTLLQGGEASAEL